MLIGKILVTPHFPPARRNPPPYAPCLRAHHEIERTAELDGVKRFTSPGRLVYLETESRGPRSHKPYACTPTTSTGTAQSAVGTVAHRRHSRALGQTSKQRVASVSPSNQLCSEAVQCIRLLLGQAVTTLSLRIRPPAPPGHVASVRARAQDRCKRRSARDASKLAATRPSLADAPHLPCESRHAAQEQRQQRSTGSLDRDAILDGSTDP